MEATGVLITRPMYTYLEQQLSTHFNLHYLNHYTSLSALLKSYPKTSIKALVTDTRLGANAEMIESLPCLEIVATNSVGFGYWLGYVKRGKWKIDADFGLTTRFSGKSVGIIGLGRISSAIAKRAEAFGCRVSYHSRSQKPHTNYKYYSNVIDLAANCQILIVSCSLTEQTKPIINRQVINTLGPSGILINIGRGAHVDEPELVSALLEGRLGGVGLDVLENEPEVPEELIGLDNVVLMPHVGSNTTETCNGMADLVVGNLVAHFKNEPLLTPVI